jgi:hypothetical protein
MLVTHEFKELDASRGSVVPVEFWLNELTPII